MRSAATGIAAGWTSQLERIARGDNEAFEQFYVDSSRYVYSLALKMLGDSLAAEDLTCEIYLHVRNNAGRLRREWNSVLAGLISLTRQRALTCRQAQGGASTVTRQDAKNRDFAIRPPDEQARVLRILEILPPDERRALELAYFSGLPLPDLAATMGVPIETVRSWLCGGMVKLKEGLWNGPTKFAS